MSQLISIIPSIIDHKIIGLKTLSDVELFLNDALVLKFFEF